MFKTLLIKEIQTAIIDFRFWVVLLLCICIIPLSFYVSVKNYSQRVSDYQQEIQTYKDQQSKNGADAFFAAEGVHPPSPLSIFSRGLDEKMPNKVITSRDGQYKIEYAKPDNKQDLLGKIDFAFIVVFVLSILALVFTFSAISGDKESGIFRLVFSNPVLRRQVLISKLLGNYIVFSIPFLLSLLLALLVVYLSGLIPIFSAQLFPSVLIMIGISMLFLFALFNLGLWISAFAKNSTLSINILLLIWIIIGLVVPKVSPIISEAIAPVESTSVFDAKKTLLYKNFTNEQIKEERELYEKLRIQFQPKSEGISSSNDLNKEYDKEVIPIRKKYEERIVDEINKLTIDYKIRCDKQNKIAKAISSLSIINSTNNLMAEFSGTGYSEANNFQEQAKQYQEMIKQILYDKIEHKIYYSQYGSSTSTSIPSGFSDNFQIPVLDHYKYLDVSQTVRQNWIDILLLFFYCILFFVGAFASFLRFDVR
ncbi:MAG: ABC transporter permease [Bacteroidales bacterium]|jgi:ABC-type transport system involved in multi-copper enzyme maturation permease subunit|nr:ABC transporter permease [Bacteroidales bacterium]